MIKVGFEFVTDSSQFIVGVGDADTALDGLRDNTKRFQKESTVAFEQAATEADNMAKGVGDAAKQTGKFNEEAAKLGKTKNAVQQLKQEIKFYTAEAYKAGEGTKAFRENLEKAGKLKDQLQDLNAQVKSLSGNMGENFARSAGNSISLVTKGYEGLTAVQILAGKNNKAFEESLLKLQSLNALAGVAQEFAGIGDKITEIKLGAKAMFDGFVAGFNRVIAFAAANPFVAIAVGVGLLVSAVILLSDKFNLFSDSAERNADRVLDGLEKQKAATEEAIKAEIALNEAKGLGIAKLEKDLLDKKIKYNKEAITEIEKQDILYRQGKKELYDKLQADNKQLQQELLLIQTAAQTERERREQEQERAAALKTISIVESKYASIADLARASGKETISIEQAKLAEVNRVIAKELDRLEGERQRKLFLNKDEVAQIEALNAKKKQLENSLNIAIVQSRVQLSQMLNDLERRADNGQLSTLTGEALFERQKEIQLAELENLKQTIIKKGQETDKGYKLSSEQLQQFALIEQSIQQEASRKLLEFKATEAAKLAALAEKSANDRIRMLELEEQIKIDTVRAERKPDGISEEDFEKSKSTAILNIQKQAILDMLSAKLAAVDANVQLTKEQAEKEKEAIVAQAKATIAEIDGQLSKAAENNKFSLAKLLGATPEQLSAAVNALNQVAAAEKEFLQSKINNIDKEISKNQQLIDSRQKNIDNLNNQLQQEYQLRADGSASNINLLEQEIAQEEAAKQMALANDQKLKQQREKLARQQLITDTITQGSNLLVASSQIFATTAKDPVTTAIAALTVAAMIAAFAKTKSDAFKAVNENNFAEGVIDLQGPGTETSDSIRANLSKGESVMTAKETREHKKLFLGIREEDDRMITEGIMNLLKNRGISLIPDVAASFAEKRNHLNNLLTIGSGGMGLNDAHLLSMNKKFDVLLKQNSSKTYTDAKGNLIIQQGSHIRIVRNG